MIDTNELRRLAQKATSGEWYVERGNHIYGRIEVTDGEEKWHPVIACTDDDETNVAFEANAAFIAAANPAAISELLDRLEVAEAEALEEARLNGMGSEREAALMAKLESAENEATHQKALAESALRVAKGWERKCDELRAELKEIRHGAGVANDTIKALRAKIEAMEKQEPVAWMDRHGTLYNSVSHVRPSDKPLYALPGAQPAPSVPDGWLHHAARMATLARKLREPDWCLESIREMQGELRTLEEAALAAHDAERIAKAEAKRARKAAKRAKQLEGKP